MKKEQVSEGRGGKRVGNKDLTREDAVTTTSTLIEVICNTSTHELLNKNFMKLNTATDVY